MRTTLTLIALSSLMATIIIFNSTKLYRSETSVIAKETSGSLASLGGQAATLASIAGINFNSSGNKAEVALAKLESKIFIINFIHKNNLKRELFAVSGWDKHSDKLIFNEDIYDHKNDKWRPDKSSEPSNLEAFEKMTSRININKHVATGIITIAFDHPSPNRSAVLTNQLIEELNNTIMKEELEETTRLLKFLKSEVDKTPITEMKQIFYTLIEEQTKNFMLANASSEYMLKTIDPAIPPEKQHSPKTIIIFFACAIAASILGFSFSILKYYPAVLKEH